MNAKIIKTRIKKNGPQRSLKVKYGHFYSYILTKLDQCARIYSDQYGPLCKHVKSDYVIICFITNDDSAIMRKLIFCLPVLSSEYIIFAGMNLQILHGRDDAGIIV